MYRILILVSLMFLGVHTHAQRVHLDQVFGLGSSLADISGNASFQNGNVVTQSQFSVRVKQYGFVWGPRIDLVGSRQFSVSLAAPLFLGLSTTSRFHSVNTDTSITVVDGLHRVHLALEVPVFADINIGLRSASDPTRNHFGVFGGLGYTYSYTRIRVWKGAFAGPLAVDSWEPVLRAGIRMGASWEKRWSLVFNLRGRFEKSAPKTYGLQIVKEI